MSAVVSIEPVHSASNSMFISWVLKRADRQVEDVALDLSVTTYRVVVRELNRFNAFKMLDSVQTTLTYRAVK